MLRSMNASLSAPPRYAELHAYSPFSFQRGASSVRDLLVRGRELGLTALAITDRNGLYAAVRQWVEAQRLDQQEGHGSSAGAPRVGRSSLPTPRPVYGSELTLDDGSRVVALVRNREGWRNLSSLISESRMACEKGSAFLTFRQLVQRSGGLTILSGGRFGPVDRALLGLDVRPGHRPRGPWGQPLGSWLVEEGRRLAPAQMEGPSECPQAGRELFSDDRAGTAGSSAERAVSRLDPSGCFRRARSVAARFRDALGDHFVLELHNHQLPEDQWSRVLLQRISKELRIPRAATNLVHYARQEDRRMQDVLSCVRLHTTLDMAGTRLLPNAHFHLKGPEAMARLFADDPGAVDLTVDLAADCRFDFSDLPYTFPVYPTPRGESLQSYLEEVTWQGAQVRYGQRLDRDPRIKKQLQHELRVIGRMGLAGYFLVVWDISEECRKRGILSQGRGSAANSCVCYCLQITAVDPIHLDLLFERFLSEARGGYPDIDIDISNHRREEIIQFVYEKYGRRHAAMVCNVITYHPRSAIRDVSRAFGLGLDQSARMARALSHHGGVDELRALFAEGGDEWISDDSRVLKQVVEYTEKLCGLPRHLGIHSGGFVIGGGPLSEACPIENATMKSRTVLQWDKDDVAHAGLIKIDLLALGMLSVIEESSRLLASSDMPFQMSDLTYDDPQVYDLISAGDTVGVFQIESRAQMNTLPRLQPRCFHDLVVEVALIRPGPIQGDMVHPYLRRRQGREPVDYAHPSLEPILKRTLGIPLFQEQVMRMAVATAGFTPAEADRLRRVMGFRRSTEEMEQLFAKMVEGMQQNGLDPATAQRVRDQMRGFAAYGFPESHAASFALIVYASAWLKTYRASAFFAGLLNCQPMGFYSPATLVGDARRHGVTILPLCVNRSDWRWRLEGKRGLRAGLLQVKGLGQGDGTRLEQARGTPFRSALDLCDRTGLARDKLEKLADAGAFACFGLSRRQALWEVAGYRKRLPLEGPPRQQTLPGFSRLSKVEANLMDHAVSGFSAGEHPVRFARPALALRGVVPSGQLKQMKDGSRAHVAGMVVTRQRPSTAKGTFFVTLEDEEGFANLIVRSATYEKHERLLRRVQFLACRGRVQLRDGVVHVLASAFEDLEHQGLLSSAETLGPERARLWRGMRSRDFR